MASPRPADALVRALSADGGVSVRAVVGTTLVEEAVRRHRPSPSGAAALGRALLGGVLLAAGAKDGETLQLQLRGDGPLGAVTVIADGTGAVRGFVGRPDVDALLGGGPADVGRAIGRGHLSVVRYRPGWREPYTGVVDLISGEVAEDLAHYLATSEQTPSAVALGVWLSDEREVAGAAGFLVQALPGASEATVEIAEENARALPNPSALVRDGLDADGLVDRLLHGIGSRGRERSAPRFHCPCERERVAHAARLLGPAELREQARRGEPLEVRCEFCGVLYTLDPAELTSLADSSEAPGGGRSLRS